MTLHFWLLNDICLIAYHTYPFSYEYISYFLSWVELNWLFNVTINDISVIPYMWRHIDVQADWRRGWTYGRAHNAIDIS